MSHSVEETYAVYDERSPVARKEHRCDACDERIAPGQQYARIGIVFQGEAESVKRCLRCQAIHEYLRDKDPGETWPAERLDCGEKYEDHWGEDPPERIAALAFALPREMQP